MQEDHPLAFIGRSLGSRWQKLFVREKTLLVIVFAVRKMEQYLVGNHFVIKTDQKSLKWLLQFNIKSQLHFTSYASIMDSYLKDEKLIAYTITEQ